MTLNEYFDYIMNPLAEAKVRVVSVPPGECWTALRRFCQKRGDVELRLSDLVKEGAWLPMPNEVFGRLCSAMTTQELNGNGLVLLGMSGYLALLTDENKRAAIVSLREWVDGASGREAVCLLRNDESIGLILKDVFANPRYRQGRQLIEIDDDQVVSGDASEETERIVRRTEVMLVGDDLASFIPEACDTFQKYLRYTEEHPNDCSVRRIVVASKGQELAGLSAEVRQIVCLRDFTRVFYNVEAAGLSEDALRWMCERGREGAGQPLVKTLMTLFFPGGEVERRALCVFDGCKNVERQALLWLVKHVAAKGSYLKRVMGQEGIIVSNFRSAYVTGATQWLDNAMVYSSERKDAIREANLRMSDADIRQFIARCAGESTSRVAAWLNCGTSVERAELLRRCAEDGFVSSALKDVYSEVAAYVNSDIDYGDVGLDNYFRAYRELKIIGRVTLDFYERAQQAVPPSSVKSRDEMVQRYASDNECGLLMVDAMGAEWLPMLVVLALERNIGVDLIEVAKAHLPTITRFNKIHWPDSARRLPDIKRFDNIVHNGVETHETRRAEENLAAALDVIGSEVLPRVAEGLARFERVLVTADHGSTRLAVLAWQVEPKLAQTLRCEPGAEVADWRYRERAAQGECPPELEETLDGRHWVVCGYNRLPKKGGGQSFEQHGGATLEERLVPFVIFSRSGQFVPETKPGGKRAQLVEKDEFDL